MTPSVVDLHHLGVPGAIGVYIIDGTEPALVDPGPARCFETLSEGLGELGLTWRDIRHVLLTHIHLDHAGATGTILQQNPDALVYVHEDGAPHMVDPTRLVSSTERTFGKGSTPRLWGEILPVPADRVRPWSQEQPLAAPGFRHLHSPGHISSHIAYQSEEDGTLFSGDVMGIVLGPATPSHPPTPPPTTNLADWYATLEGWAELDVPRFGATHFGFHENFQDRRVELIEALRSLEKQPRFARATDTVEETAEAFQEELILQTAQGSGEEESDRIRKYFQTFRGDTDFKGLVFHLDRLARK